MEEMTLLSGSLFPLSQSCCRATSALGAGIVPTAGQRLRIFLRAVASRGVWFRFTFGTQN